MRGVQAGGGALAALSQPANVGKAMTFELWHALESQDGFKVSLHRCADVPCIRQRCALALAPLSGVGTECAEGRV